MSNERFSSVWDAIANTPAEAENIKLRSTLMMTLKEHIDCAGLSQSQAAKLFGVKQSRVSDLMRGKIAFFSLDTLVGWSPQIKTYAEELKKSVVDSSNL